MTVQTLSPLDPTVLFLYNFSLMEFGVGTLETRKKMVKRGEGWLVNSIHISSSKFFVYFIWKNLFFLFYTSTFIKHPHQFIYSTHLFNKTFIILLIFIIHSLTVPLSHRPPATIITQPPSPPSSETKEKSDQPTHID